MAFSGLALIPEITVHSYGSIVGKIVHIKKIWGVRGFDVIEVCYAVHAEIVSSAHP